MNISSEVLRALANERVVDLLITGDSEAIIEVLLNKEIGDQVGVIGDVVAVKLDLEELATLADQDISIKYIQVNMNSKEKKTA